MSYTQPLVGTLLLAALVLPAFAAPNPASPPDLGKDERLAVKLNLPGERLSLQEVVKRIHAATEVSIMVQGDLLRRPVAIAAKDRTAAEVLEDMAVLFGGKWLRRKDGYLLITDEVIARLIGASRLASATAQDVRRLAGSITPHQLAQLQAGKELSFDQLTPGQRQVAQRILRDSFAESPERFSASIVNGQGVVLALKQKHREAPDGTLAPAGFWLEMDIPGVLDDGSLDTVRSVVLNILRLQYQLRTTRGAESLSRPGTVYALAFAAAVPGGDGDTALRDSAPSAPLRCLPLPARFALSRSAPCITTTS